MDIVRDAFRHARTNDFARALDALAPLFEGDTFAELRGDALDYRAIILERLGRYDEARTDILAAHTLCDGPSHHRYALELALATDAKRRANADDELAWLRRALATAAADPTLPGYTAAGAVIRKVGETALSAEERAQIAATIAHGWKILELDGEPDLSDLGGALQRMAQRGGDRDYWTRRS